MQKKRGRKPKGGQVIKKSIKKKEEECNKNIILHLKVKCNSENIIKEYNYYNNDKVIKQNNISVIQTKLKNLQYDLHTNSLYNKSDCFWCTCSFKSEPIYIPNSIINNKYKVYGNFCSPQCAAAFLFNENIEEDFFNLKGILIAIFSNKFNLKIKFKKKESQWFDFSHIIKINKIEVGSMGSISKNIFNLITFWIYIL